MTEERNQNPPSGDPGAAAVASPGRWWILVALSLATTIIQFDQSGMTLALPHVQAELEATTQQLQWVMDAYSLALASVVLTAGAVSDRYGRRKVFLLGIAVLAAGSLIGALAPDANVVIAGRALMGVGGAMFMPGTLSIITHVFDRVTRPTAIGIWGAVTSLGVIVGPLISGAVLQIWHWRGIFILNVVMAAIAFTGAAALVPESRDPHPRRLDVLGALLAGVGLFGISYAVIHSSSDGVTDTVVLAAAGIGAAALVLFWLHSTRGEVSMFDLGVARNPAFLGAALAAAATMFTMAGLLFMITQQFQLVDGFGVLLAGVAVLCSAATVGEPDRWIERAEQVEAAGTQQLVEETSKRWFTPAFKAANPRVTTTIMEGLAAADDHSYAQLCRCLAHHDLRADLRDIRCPLLLIAGERDSSTPIAGQELVAETVPGAQLSVIPEASHQVTVAAPDTTANLLRAFMDRVTRQARTELPDD